MKILLVALNAKYIHSNPALFSIRAYAGEYASYMEIAEYTINQYVSDMVRDIYERKPDVVGFSCYIWNIEMIRELFCQVKKVLPHCDIFLGGPEVSYQAEEYMNQFPQLSGVMVGEGEKTWKDICRWYLGESVKLSDICGLVYRNVDKLESNPQPKVMNLDDIPFLYSDLACFDHRIIYYETSRGCPFSCSYCLSSVEKQLRFRSIKLVEKELQFFLDHKVPQVKFIDRTFNCNHEHAMAIWSYIYEHDNGLTNFHFEIGADLLREEELKLLAKMRPGLVQMEIGVQSTNEKTLHEIHRYVETSHLEEVVEKLQEPKNIHIHLDLIAGLPYEDLTSFKKSFNEVYGMKPDQLQLGFLKVLVGTCMADDRETYGLVYTDLPPYEVLSTKWLSFSDVLELKDVEEMVEQYYNSGGYRNTIKCLERLFSSAYEMFYELSIFVRSHGKGMDKQARIRGYELMLEFVTSRGENPLPWKSVLLMDIYEKEKIKTRPEFAWDLKSYRKTITEFYQAEAEHPKYLIYPQCDIPGFGGDKKKESRPMDSRMLERITHLEVFPLDVLEFISSGNVHKKEQKVLFQYGENKQVIEV